MTNCVAVLNHNCNFSFRKSSSNVFRQPHSFQKSSQGSILIEVSKGSLKGGRGPASGGYLRIYSNNLK